MKYFTKRERDAWILMRRPSLFARREVLCVDDNFKYYWKSYKQAAEYGTPMLGYATKEMALAIIESVQLGYINVK